MLLKAEVASHNLYSWPSFQPAQAPKPNKPAGALDSLIYLTSLSNFAVIGQ